MAVTRDEAIEKAIERRPDYARGAFPNIELGCIGVALDYLTPYIPGGEAALLALLSGEAVVVPREPTEAMQEASTISCEDGDGAPMWHFGTARWDKILAASPYKDKTDGPE